MIIAIDKIAEISDKTLDVIIEINVSATTCFSISFLLSSLPTKIAANPNSTVNINENTVVNTPASVSFIVQSNPIVIIVANITGFTTKQTISQIEILPVFAFLKT